MRPCARDVAGGVAAPAEEEEWEVEPLAEGDAGAVGGDLEVEGAEAVAGETVGAALEDDGRGTVVLDAFADDRFEEPGVLPVADAVVKRDVESVMGAWVKRVFRASGVDAAGAREEGGAELVEGESHDAVGGPECFFYTVAVVDVDVDIEDAGVVAEELEDGEDDIVDVAEAGCLVFLCVVEPPGPVDRNIGLVVDEFAGRVYRGAGGEGAVVEESFE